LEVCSIREVTSSHHLTNSLRQTDRQTYRQVYTSSAPRNIESVVGLVESEILTVVHLTEPVSSAGTSSAVVDDARTELAAA